MKFFNSQYIIVFVFFVLVIFKSQAVATEFADKKSYSSSGYKQNESSEQERLIQFKQKQKEGESKISQYKGMMRDDVIQSRGLHADKLSMSAPVKRDSKQASFNIAYYDFTIYSAHTQLIEDIDKDGYYQTFNVIFDADIISNQQNLAAFVYADLYLRRDGGPWVLYLTTDNFEIIGESTDDEYEVLTNLQSGYPTGEYDVLVDLYLVDSNQLIASYSADDSNALYALPLESGDYDPEYIEVTQVSGHGGTMWSMIIMLIFILIRR